MAPAGAEMASYTISSPHSTVLEAFTRSLSPEENILMTHLVVWLLALISGVFLALRFLAIWYKKFALVVEDGLLAASWIIILFYSITASISLALGTGTSSSESVATTSPSAPLLLDNVTRTAALTATAWTKSAFACGLLGLSQRRLIKWALLSLVTIINLAALGGIVVQWVRCRPIYKAWEVSVEGSCFERGTSNAVGIGVQAFFGLTDILFLLLGYILVWSKDLAPSAKAGVGFLGLLGLMAGAGAIVTAVEISTLSETDFAASNIRPLLTSSIEAPLIIIVASLPALRLLISADPFNPTSMRNRIQSFHHPQRRSSTLTPLGPFSQPALRPQRPIRPTRPMSSRSFMTTSTKVDKPGLAGISSENLIKGLDYNYNHWNPVNSNTITAAPVPVSEHYQQQQQQQPPPPPLGHTPSFSTSSSIYTAPPALLAPPSNLAVHNTFEIASAPPQYLVQSDSSHGGHAMDSPNAAINNSSSDVRNPASFTNSADSDTPYTWHSVHNTNTYAAQTMNHRLAPLEEEAHMNDVPSWYSSYTPIEGLARNNSKRKESPTLGTEAEIRNRVEAPRKQTPRERDLLETEREFEYDTPQRSRLYFSRLQALSGYAVGNPFTSRI